MCFRYVLHHVMTVRLCVPDGKKMKGEDVDSLHVVGTKKLPPSKCIPEVAHFIIRQHVEAPSMWAIFPLQDLLALKEEDAKRPAAEETINDSLQSEALLEILYVLPPILCVHVTLETLLKDKELKKTIRGLVRGSGRSCPLDGQETGSTPAPAATNKGTDQGDQEQPVLA
ncbi:hypothetical protein Cgig2_001397 [Carnegiea gigantea]|uniref:Uncharacterized protein n=1 Tax=Carnegiea gigantea TaxID=171969 RepID=A0A9Q1KRW5_9CARY|nr:hypothetical protein Cgig2_001397 [Carnegiea gigantea]